MMKILCLTIGLVLIAISATAQTTPPSSVNRMLTSNNAWLNVNSEPPCAPSTTTGTITLALGSPCANPVNPTAGGSPDNWQFTLTGNGTLATTGPYSPGQVFGIQVTEGPSTAFTLAAPTGWSVQGLCTAAATPVAACSGANGLALSGVANGKNILTCKIIDTTPTIWCGPVLAGLTTVSTNPTIVQSNGAAGSGTSASVSLSNFVSGHIGYILVGWCGTASCLVGTENITTVTATGGTCTLITGTSSGISVPLPVAAYRCINVSAGSVTFQVNWGATATVPNIAALEISNDGGTEAGNVANGTGTAPSVTSGTLTQASGELVISYAFAFNNTTAVNSPFTFVNTGGNGFAYYSVPTCSSCTEAVTFTSGSGTWTADAFAIKHP